MRYLRRNRPPSSRNPGASRFPTPHRHSEVICHRFFSDSCQPYLRLENPFRISSLTCEILTAHTIFWVDSKVSMAAAATILAVIPLVIEGFKAYSNAVEALSTIRQYSSIVTRLKVTVKTHETIFKNSSAYLESTLERYRELGSLNREQLSETRLRTENLLKESLDVGEMCLHEIERLLNTIVKVLEGFRMEVSHLQNSRHAHTSLMILGADSRKFKSYMIRLALTYQCVLMQS